MGGIVHCGMKGGADAEEKFGNHRCVIAKAGRQLQGIGQVLGAQANIPRLPALQRLRLKSIIGTIVG
jgi:hypothetical protein